ncbi:bacillithiol system redox-active protein YtxJ [Cohnella sp. CFH 77786]|uniref:bacillithiol system redox-active protein YtxJ n=1 Tax=Cohnella sp. CFH 77786 TaxID=2662265 RepID=UPI001C60F2E9|nr:bacillithiol system redox-active protein YtxJ [Cohnella sp. CFH 77786]MBW5444714.1 bacillithiol system redox-active protein YtxJ [Cohnella sp. CFH 77786]
MTEIRQLTSLEQWKDAIKGSAERPLLVFKHSTSCPISAGAHEELTSYVKDSAGAEVDVAIVHVIEDRPVSNAIAEELGVQHKSPQAILVEDGKPVWNESHWNLTYAFFSDKLGRPANAAE